MTENPAATTTTSVEITERQRQIVLDALYEKLLDTKRYVFNSEVADEPGPLDTCCDAHLARYEQHRDTHRALKQQQEAVEAAIELFSVGEDPGETEGHTA